MLIRQGKHVSTEYRPLLSEGGQVLDGVMDDGTGNYVKNTNVLQNYRYFYRFRQQYNVYDIVDDASWVRLRSLSFAYSLPKSIFGEGKYLKGLTASFTGTNLFISTDYRGFDPEISRNGAASNAQGYSGFSTPNTSTYSFSLNFTF
jgi:hypothetical protein